MRKCYENLQMAISGGVYMVNIDYGGVGSANGYYMERVGYGCG